MTTRQVLEECEAWIEGLLPFLADKYEQDGEKCFFYFARGYAKVAKN